MARDFPTQFRILSQSSLAHGLGWIGTMAPQGKLVGATLLELAAGCLLSTSDCLLVC